MAVGGACNFIHGLSLSLGNVLPMMLEMSLVVLVKQNSIAIGSQQSICDFSQKISRHHVDLNYCLKLKDALMGTR